MRATALRTGCARKQQRTHWCAQVQNERASRRQVAAPLAPRPGADPWQVAVTSSGSSSACKQLAVAAPPPPPCRPRHRPLPDCPALNPPVAGLVLLGLVLLYAGYGSNLRVFARQGAPSPAAPQCTAAECPLTSPQLLTVPPSAPPSRRPRASRRGSPCRAAQLPPRRPLPGAARAAGGHRGQRLCHRCAGVTCLPERARAGGRAGPVCGQRPGRRHHQPACGRLRRRHPGLAEGARRADAAAPPAARLRAARVLGGVRQS